MRDGKESLHMQEISAQIAIIFRVREERTSPKKKVESGNRNGGKKEHLSRQCII